MMWGEAESTFAPNVCRLCANVGDFVIPMFGKEGERVRLDLKINKCLPIVVRKEDEKPKQLCLPCVSKLEVCNELLELCLAAEFKFESILQGRFPTDKGMGTDATEVQTQAPPDDQTDKTGLTVDDPLTVVPMLGPRPTRVWPTEDPDKPEQGIVQTRELTQVPTTVTVEHSTLAVHTGQLAGEGVIVLGKADPRRRVIDTGQERLTEFGGRAEIHTTNGAEVQCDDDCQDILLMVELKYKDDLIQPDGTPKATAVAYTTQAEPAPATLDTRLAAQSTVVLDPTKYKRVREDVIQPPQETAVPRIEKPFSCEVCGKSFMRRTNLNAHIGVHTQVKPYSCDLCGKRFCVRWDLTLHQRIHSGLFTCEFCGKAFSVKGKLERHRRVHTGEKPFACDICAKAFSDKRNLEAHRRCHTGEKPYSCKICGRSFRVKSHLSDHRRVHSQEKPYTCHICGKSFKWKTNLNIHLKLHRGEHFTCDLCGRRFARKGDLVKHHQGHSGEKPYACEECEKRFADRATLQKHLKCHSDDKPYSCDLCGKNFHFHWYLNTHKKIHSEEKPYTCDLCGKTFNKKGNLLSHKKFHNGDKPYPCEICNKTFFDIQTLTKHKELHIAT